MNRLILTTATAALLAGASALPVLSAAPVDLSSMTCADFRALEEDKQMEVSAMAMAELQNDDAASDGTLVENDGTATATEPSGGTTAEDVDDASSGGTLVENDGTATATDGTDTPDRDPMAVSYLESLQASCDLNSDAGLLEAAAGNDTQK